jgi:hypothetical protein
MAGRAMLMEAPTKGTMKEVRVATISAACLVAWSLPDMCTVGAGKSGMCIENNTKRNRSSQNPKVGQIMNLSF